MNMENIPAPEKNLSQNKEENRKTTWKDIVKEIGIFALIAFGIVLPFRMFIAEPYLVDGRSMDPTFKTGDYLIVNKFTYRFKTPMRNSVIVFRYPNDTSKSFIKRIIGLPGETVIVKDNNVTIINAENPEGFQIDQSYVTHESPGSYKKTLAPDEYFVMGDNRAESFDSRAWGPLPKKDILGEPILQLWPFNKVSFLPGDDRK